MTASASQHRAQAVAVLVERSWLAVELASDVRRLRGSLFHGLRTGTIGRMRDLQDLLTLVHETRTSWQIMRQLCGADGDPSISNLCGSAIHELDESVRALEDELNRAANWMPTGDSKRRLIERIPRSFGVTTIPDFLWTPFAAAFLILLVGLVGTAGRCAWLGPSLGATAYLQAARPNAPSARTYHVLVGHFLGLSFALVALAVTGALSLPPFHGGTLSLTRVFAAALAAWMALLSMQLFKATHPPAASTTMLVSLGFVRSQTEVFAVVLGIGVLAIVGEILRRLRTGEPLVMPPTHNVPTAACRRQSTS